MSTAGESDPLLAERVAVVTGAAGGIGHRIAHRLAAHGAAVGLIDLDRDRTEATAVQVAAATGSPTLGVAADVTDPASLTVAADLLESRLGPVDVVVPNAGILVIKPALELRPEEFEAVVRVNLFGAFCTATEFARRMVDRPGDGRIIFTSSLFGLRGGAGNAAYSASKFAVLGLAQSLAAELAPAGIRVNTVCPGQIETPMITGLLTERAAAAGSTMEEELARFVRHIPLGALGTTEEVADTYVYLASSLSSYVTGQHLVIDGGWSVGSG